MNTSIQQILQSKDLSRVKTFFAFEHGEPIERVIFKYNLWMRKFFPQYFSSGDAAFHRQIDLNNLKVYIGELAQFVDIAFKGAAKTSRTKLFMAYVVANGVDQFRKYMRILTADTTNSVQITTDIYNMLVSSKVAEMYPELFAKTTTKREETMSSFTTATGIKVFSDTVNTSQRGALQEEARPDFVWFEDFENRKTLRSIKTTKAIWDNMEEARTGLAKNGGCLYTCNYISEMGNVHTLVTRPASSKFTLIVPIIQNGILAWPDRYSAADVEQMKQDDDDFEGERLCLPSASKDIIFDREILDAMKPVTPIKEIAGLKIFHKYDPSHNFGSGHDVGHGVGIDSSTSAFIDFSTMPMRVVGTFASNEIKPETFGDEIDREGDYFGKPIAGIERNDQGGTTIARAKQLGVTLYKSPPKVLRTNAPAPTEYGWHTNAATKPKMIFALVKAVNDGLLELSDPALIAECKSYTRGDLIEDQPSDPRLITRHFDLLTAAAIAYQMKDHVVIKRKEEDVVVEEDVLLYPEIGM